MPDFTAKDVQALRRATGAGMLDCKRALEETDGDMDEGQAVAARAGARRRGQAFGPRGDPRGGGPGCVRAQRGDRRAALRDRLRRQVGELRHPHRRARPARGGQGLEAAAERSRRHRRAEDHAQGEHLGGPGRPVRDGRGLRGRDLPAHAVGSGRERRAGGDARRHRRAGARRRRPRGLRPSVVPPPRGRAPGRGRGRARHGGEASPATRESPRRRSPRSSTAG